MANPEQSTEPSMEDILASIRKIISDDDEVPEGGAVEDAAPATEDDQDRAFELADGDVFEAEAPAPDSGQQDAEPDVFESLDDIDAMFDDTNAVMPADEDDDVFDAISADEPVADEPFEEEPVADVLALSEETIVEPEAEAEEDAFAPIITEAVDSDLEFSEIGETVDELPEAAEPEAETPAEPEPQADEPAAASSHQGLLSDTSNVAVSSAFGNLASVMLSSDSRTLEDLVKEMLRPMLAGWLDENLPPLVERLVREEIERVSRGGR